MNDIIIEHLIPPSDAVRLREILIDLDKVIIPRLSDRVDLNDYALKLAELADIFYITKDNRDIGNCAVYLNSAEYGFISSIAIKKEYQRMNLGKKLLERVKEIATSKGISKIRLEVFENNSDAIAFYKRMGFHIIEKKDNWFVMQANRKVER